MEFEWDPRKNALNKKKHGVSFEEAAPIFADSRTITIPDPDHSDSEERWISIGTTPDGRVFTVCHTFRSLGPAINPLISARKATRKEKLTYFSIDDSV